MRLFAMVLLLAQQALTQNALAPFVLTGGGGTPTYAFALDAVSSNSTDNGASVVWDHAVTAAEGNRALYVGIAYWGCDAISISAVTYNSVAMTLVGAQCTGSTHHTSIYRLMNPATGTHQVSVTLSGNPYSLIAGAWSFTGVNQSTPNGTFADDDGYGETATLSLASASGDIGIGIFFASQFEGTVGGGQTRDFWQQPDADGAGVHGTASGATLNLTIACDGSRTWTTSGVAVKGN